MERFPAIVVFYRLSEKLLFSWKLVQIGLYVMQKDVLSVFSSKHMSPILDYLQISKHARYGFDRIEKKRKIKWKVRTSVFILPMRTLKLCIFAKRPQSVLWANINDFESIFSDFSFFIDYRKKDFFVKTRLHMFLWWNMIFWVRLSSEHMFHRFDYLHMRRHARYRFDSWDENWKVKWKVRTRVLFSTYDNTLQTSFAKIAKI